MVAAADHCGERLDLAAMGPSGHHGRHEDAAGEAGDRAEIRERDGGAEPLGEDDDPLGSGKGGE